MFAIITRELRTYFQTPIGYVFMGLFLVISGFFFTIGNLFSGSSNYSSFLQSILFIYLLAVPLLTMRLLSEERRQRTDQLLLTSPITVAQIVLGKFFAAFGVFLVTLVVTIAYAVVVGIFGDLAVWQTVGGYIGFTFLGAAFISVGILVSTVSENQVASAFFTFFALLLIWFLNLIKTIVPTDPIASTVFAAVLVLGLAAFFFLNTRSWIVSGIVGVIGAIAIVALHLVQPSVFDGLIPNVLDWFSLLERFQGFGLGLLKVEDIAFYVSFTAAFLFVTIRLIEKRRWS